MPHFVRLALCVALAVLCAVLIAACSGDSQQEAQQAQQQSPPQDQQQAQQEEAQPQSSAGPSQRGAEQQSEAEPLRVVTSTTIIADWVRRVGGPRVEVTALVPPGADVHTLELSTGDIRAVAAADLVVLNGATLEAAYEDAVIDNAARLLVLTEALEEAGYELSPFSELAASPDHAGEHDHEEDEHEHEEDEHEHEEDEHEEEHEHEEGHAAPVGRLLVGDAEAASLSVIDLASGEVSPALFDAAAPAARVYASPSGRFGFAAALGPEDDDDRVQIFDGGIFLTAHDDHYDLITLPIAQLPLELTDERPIHVVSSHGWTVIFADGSGRALLINEAELARQGAAYEPIALDAGLQHGVALAVSEDRFVVSSNNPDYPENSPSSLPLGVELRDIGDRVIYDASSRDCPGLHGEAHNSAGVLFGCSGGVLFLHTHDGEFDHWFIENPPEMRDGSRIGSVYGHPRSPIFFGRASYSSSEGFVDDGIWLIDPEADRFSSVLPADDEANRSVGAAFGPHGERFYVLTLDGRLQIFDPHHGELLASAALIDPIDPQLPPTFTIAGEMLYLADPAAGRVIAYHLDDMEIESEWELPGRPRSIAFLGVADPADTPGEGHEEHGDHEDHDEHEEEEHDEHEEDEEHDEHGHEEDEHGHAHAHGSEDPHFWFDADLASVAVDAVAAALSELDPAGADDYANRAAAYRAEIALVDEEVRAALADLPEQRRLLVTFHDAFGYFARRYGLTIAGFVVEGPEQGVSAAAIAELIELIDSAGVERIFREPQFESSTIEAVARESGAQVADIWSQPAGAVTTYLELLRANAAAISAP